MRALSPEPPREFEFLPRPAPRGQITKSFGPGKVERGFEMGGGMSKQPALHSHGLGGEAGEIESNPFRSGGRPASAADRPPAQSDLVKNPGQFRFPPAFLVPGQFRHLRKAFTKLRVHGFQQRQNFVADAIARKGKVAVGGVLAPWLIVRVEPHFDLSAPGVEEWAKNPAFRKAENRVNAREAFGPGAAQKFRENRLRLIVERVRRGHSIKRNLGEQPPEPGIAQAPGGAFDGVGRKNVVLRLSGNLWSATRLGRGVNARFVKGQAKLSGKFTRKLEVAIGFGSAKAVMQVSGMKNNAQFPAPLGEHACQRNRIGAAGEPHRKPHSRLEHRGIERQFRHSAHERIIVHLRANLDNRRHSLGIPLHTRHFFAIVELMTDRSYLGEFELMLLLAVIHLGDEAYGVPISRELEKHRGKDVAVGSVYAALERLESKGLVTSTLGDPTPERGGKAKRFFRITKEGLRQVHETRRVLTRLWRTIPDLKFDSQ